MGVYAAKSPKLSKDMWHERWVLIDDEFDVVVDDAQGYGYKSEEKALRAWYFKTHDCDFKERMEDERSRVQRFLKEHPDVDKIFDKIFQKAIEQKRQVYYDSNFVEAQFEKMGHDWSTNKQGGDLMDLLPVVLSPS